MRLMLTGLAAAALVAPLALAPAASAQGNAVRAATMDGSHPGAGQRPDEDARATTRLELKRDTSEVCWTIRFENVEVRGLTIFRAGTQEEALELYDEAPHDGPSLSGCDPADRALLGELESDPGRFYVRAFEYGGGAIAGTLTVPAGGPTPTARSTSDACPAERVPEDGFGDVPDSNPHESTIDCVVWWKVSSGRTATSYAPAALVTRAQMATFLANAIDAAGGTLPPAARDHFADDNGSQHEDNINRLFEAGVVKGRSPGEYGPQLEVTRAAMATFLSRTYSKIDGAQELPASADYFSDDNGSTHEPNINRAAEAGFTGGAAGGGYAPTAPVRRDQMASFLARLLDLAVEQGHGRLPDERTHEPA